MKRSVALFLAVIALFTVLCGCKRIERPEIKIKYDSVNAIEFKKRIFSDQNDNKHESVLKTVTKREDIDSLLKWIESLDITEHEAIEIPAEKVEYYIVLDSIKEHELIFFDNYVVYDTTAYTFDDPDDKQSVAEKYNLLNYEQKETELGLFK